MISKEFWPELILSDVMMPEMQEMNSVLLLRRMLKLHTFRYYYLQLWGMKNILDGLTIGADEYIVKPFSVKLLKANIANLFVQPCFIASAVC